MLALFWRGMTATKYDRIFIPMAYWAWCSLALFLFLSISLSTLFYIFMIIPGFYYTYRWVREDPRDIPLSTWALLVACFFMALSVALREEGSNMLSGILRVKYFLMCFLSIAPTRRLLESSFLTLKRKKIFLYLLLIGPTAGHLSGIMAYLTDYNYLKMKPACIFKQSCGMYGMPTTYGCNAAFLTLIFIYFLIEYRKFSCFIKKNLLIIASIISFAGLYLAFSRAAFLGFLMAFPFLFLQKGKKYALGLALGSFATISGIVIAIFLDFHPSFLDRYTLKFKSIPNTERIDQYKTALRAFQDNPILGVGLENSEPLKKKYHTGEREFYINIHNGYLETLAGSGLLGFIPFILFFLFWAIEIFRSTGFLKSLFLPLFIVFASNNLFQSTLLDSENMFFIIGVYSLFHALNLPRSPSEISPSA